MFLEGLEQTRNVLRCAKLGEAPLENPPGTPEVVPFCCGHWRHFDTTMNVSSILRSE